MADGDHYRLTLHQTLRFQRVLNVFHYFQVGGTGNASNISSLFQATVVAALAAMTSDDLSYDRLVIENLDDEFDVWEDITVTPSVGGVTDQPAPLRLALAFRSSRPSMAYRYSWKRFAGIASGILTSPVWNISNANVIAAATALTATLVGGTGEWKPCQIRYTYPGGGASPTHEMRYVITGWSPIEEPSTQDSRTLGRGI